MAAPVSHPALGNIEVVNNPITMSESPEVPYTATPERGEHTEEVLSEYGYSPEEIESFRGDGTI
jgi:formyl-CoA transferase